MSRIESDREIRTAAHRVGRVDCAVKTLVPVRADRRHHMPTSGETEYSDFVRIDMPARCLGAHESDGSLCVEQCGVTVAIRPDSEARHTILQQHAGDASRRQPIAGFGTFEIDGENEITTTREHDDCRARVAPVW